MNLLLSQKLTDTTKGTLHDTCSPVFNRNMLVASTGKLGRHGNRSSIEIRAWRDPRQVEDGGSQIDVSRYRILHIAFRDSGATNEQGDSDVLFKTACLARWESVLADVEPVVRGIYNVGVIQLVAFFQTLNEVIHQLVDSLQGTQARSVEVVVVIDHALVLLGQIANPADAAGLLHR